ncbi:MAG: TMEM43 family protein [Candidatus Xenobiia bacterium LiM19]
MADEFREVTGQSWFGRIKDSCGGVVVGIIIFIIAIPLIFWNEGRAVKTAMSLKEGAKAVVSISADEVNSANDGKLVHLTGLATADETLNDREFAVSAKGIKLRRKAEMYQWKEEKKTDTRKKIGGGSETVTTYKYDKVWSEELIKSSSFKKPEGHRNPASMAYTTKVEKAGKVTIGAFTLSDSLVDMIDKYEPLPLSSEMLEELPTRLQQTMDVSDNYLYRGNDPANPAIGDIRLSFAIVKPLTISIIAQQSGSTFQSYQTRAGDAIQRLEAGTVNANEMFKHAEQENNTMTWIIRVVGFLLLFFGLMMVLKPLSTLADLIPFVGNLLDAGIGIVSFLIALAIWTGVVAVAWISARPLLAVGLIVVTLGAVIGVLMMKKKAAPQG